MERQSFREYVREHRAIQAGIGLMAVGATIEIASLPLDNPYMMMGGYLAVAGGALLAAREALRRVNHNQSPES